MKVKPIERKIHILDSSCNLIHLCERYTGLGKYHLVGNNLNQQITLEIA